MKSNFTKFASLFLLALSIIMSGCKSSGGNSTGTGSGPVSITSINPTAGPAGTEVTIKGKNFASKASDNTVTFAGNKKANVTSASSTQLKVEVPDGAITGAVNVEVGTESVSSDNEFAVAPQIYADLPGNKTLITRDERWAHDTTIAGPHYVLPGVTLTVKEGVTVKFKYHNNNAADVGTIITLPGDWDNFSDGFHPSGRLVAKGSPDNPIIFTSAKASPEVGDWGGIILAGNASNNWPGGQGEIEGLSKGVQYGVDTSKHDFIDDDDSGTLSYVQINYTGYSIADGSELQALTPYALGSKTQLDHISIFKSLDDGIEPFGGTVNIKYLVVVGAQDDSFDGDAGWQGYGQFYLAVETGPANRGMENDGCASGSISQCSEGHGPSQFHIYNATVYSAVGGRTNGEIPMSGMMLREGLQGHYGNVILANLKNKLTTAPIYIEDDGTRNGIGNDLTFGGNIAYKDGDYSAAFDTLGYTAQDLDLMKVDSNTQLFNDPENYDFSLPAGSPALEHFEQVPTSSFLTQTNFSGAVGPTGSGMDWTAGAKWIKWHD